MAIFHFNKRNMRSAALLSLFVVLLYVVLNAVYMLTMTPLGNSLMRGRDRKSTSMEVEVSNIIPDSNGNVQVVLNVNVRDLLRYLSADTLANLSIGQEIVHPPPLNASILMQNTHLCEGLPDLKYIIYVHTAPGNRLKRDLLRSTWANPGLFKKQITQVVFLMGRPSEPEMQQKLTSEFKDHGDLVQGDFVDDYRNLTLKGVLGLRWVSKYCANAPFAIKADDDAFVNIFESVKLFAKYEDKKRLIACPLWKDNSMPILRDPAKCSKWCVKYNEFPGRKYFPKYCAGLAFALSRDVIQPMLEASYSTPFFWIDDVYITGLLAAKVKNLQYLDLLKHFTLKRDMAMSEYKNDSLTISHYFVHAKEKDILMVLWDNMLRRLPLEDIQLISDKVIEATPILKDRAAKLKH